MRSAVVAMLAAFVLLASAPVYADGKPTAAEVTDGATLKAFVEGAKEVCLPIRMDVNSANPGSSAAHAGESPAGRSAFPDRHLRHRRQPTR